MFTGHKGGAATTHGLDRSYWTTPARDTAGRLATDSVRDLAGSGAGRPRGGGGADPSRPGGRTAASSTSRRLQYLPSASCVGLPALPLDSGKHAHRWAPLPPPETDHLSTFCALRPPLPRAWEFAVSKRGTRLISTPQAQGPSRNTKELTTPSNWTPPENHAAKTSPAPEAVGRVPC